MKVLRLLPLAAMVGCGSDPTPTPAPTEAPVASEAPAATEAPAGVSGLSADPRVKALFKPAPDGFPAASGPASAALVDLGRMLYFDPRLSLDDTVACNSCHLLDGFGVDNKPVSTGVGGKTGDRNSPTVYFAAAHLAQFWDGREPDVEAQAKGPILNPVEMAMPSGDAVVAKLQAIPGYVAAFEAAFPGQPMNYDQVGTAIGAFERQLVTRGRWDEFLGGKDDALTAQEQAGLKTFLETGCTGCHNGVALGGTSFQKLGLVQPYETKDQGRKAATNQDADAFFFKVPTLRNVTRTGPYLHDGSVADLGEMVRIMARVQLGRELDDQQVADMMAFLGALEGQPDKAYVQAPTLPAPG